MLKRHSIKAFSSIYFDISLIVVSILIATVFRLWLTHGYNFPFWFDTARDAVVSREILENHHLKLQGPNASGTKDTVFHGVLYYYIIGPLYTLAQGNPQLVVYGLGFLSAFAVIPVYLLTKELSGSRKASVLSTLSYAVSLETARAGTWLGNPVIATVVVPFFFYFLWQVFFNQQKKYWLWLTFCIGVATQAVLFLVVLWIGVLLSALYSAATKRFRLSLGEWLKGFAVYTFTISSMILVELRIIKAGLFHFSNFSDFTTQPISAVVALAGTLQLYIEKISNTLLPSFPVAGIILFLIAIWITFRKVEKSRQFFLLLMLSFPLWLLSWNYREMYHLFIGLEVPVVIIVSIFLGEFLSRRRSELLLGICCLIFLGSHLRAGVLDQQLRRSNYVLPQGAFLKDQLALVAQTFEIAQDKSFSISTLTNPYGYNTTWAYVYSWYAQAHGLEAPLWFGPDQNGIFGGGLLRRTPQPLSTHFSIYEPKEGIPNYLQTSFTTEQAQTGTSSAKLEFGSLHGEVY